MEALLPANFLSKPAPGEVTKKMIDWEQTTLPENKNRYAVVLDGLFTEYECKKLVAAAEATNMAANGVTWEQALINAGGGKQILVTDYRNSGRILVDDTNVAALIWRRIAPFVPELARDPIANNAALTGNGPAMRGEVYRFACLNERMRFLQYTPGGFFQPHCDSYYIRDDMSERSFFTLHLYLNEASESNPLQGGATSFHDFTGKPDRDVHVEPKIGRVLIFQHRDLLHSGQLVESGLKLTMRTDIMFKETDEKIPEDERPFNRSNKPKKTQHYEYMAQRVKSGAT